MKKLSLPSLTRRARPLALASLLSLNLLLPARADINDVLQAYPQETTSVVTLKLDPASWLPLLGQDGASPEGEVSLQKMYQEFKQNFASMGLDLEKEVLPVLGSHLALGYGYSNNSSPPAPMVVLHHRSEAKAREVLDKLMGILRDHQEPVYRMTLQGKPIWKLVSGEMNTVYVAVTPQALLLTFEDKPDMLSKAMTVGQHPDKSLLASPDVQTLSQAAAEDSLWFYGETPRLLSDIYAFMGTVAQPDLAKQRVLAQNLKNLLSLLRVMDFGMTVSTEGLSFHSLNLYSQQAPSLEQSAYLKALRTPSDQPLEGLLATVPARNYGVLASDRLAGLSGLPLPKPQNAQEQAAAELYAKMDTGHTLQQLTGLKPEQYLPHLDGRYSLSLTAGAKMPEAVLAVGVRPQSVTALGELMAGFKLNQSFVRDSLLPPDSRRRGQSASVRANMHTLQTMVETYGVDHEGLYPHSLAELEKAARNSSYNYWKTLSNPLDRPYVFGD
ncbi:MAG: DUF3352 domain-containing protein [Candidatus Sericytochromatia bacterium]